MNETRMVKYNGKILGYTIWRILAYFVIYSFLGFCVETLYGMVTKGVLESRQSFLYGPFCAIYGLGAILMILSLQFFTKSNNYLFFGGFIVGSIIEYVVSLLGEMILHVKWWDYSNMPFNLNGRICVFFSIFWGLLAIYLMSYVNPRVDRLIDRVAARISMNRLRGVTILVNLLLLADCLATVFALDMFFTRIVHENNLPVAGREIIDKQYEDVYTNEKMVAVINRFFNDRKMIRTFPNLKMEATDGTIIYFNSFVPDVQPYYYRLNANLRGDLVKILKEEEKAVNLENRINFEGKENHE